MSINRGGTDARRGGGPGRGTFRLSARIAARKKTAYRDERPFDGRKRVLHCEYYKFLWRQGLVEFSKGIPYGRWLEYPAVVDRLALGPADRLLDVGTRYSPLAQVLAKRFRCSVRAVDPEPDFRDRQLRMANKVPWTRRLMKEGRLDFTVADAARLPFADGDFTRISVISVLEHIVDERPVLAELVRVLAPGGRMVISVPFDPWRDEPKYARTRTYVDGRPDEARFYMRYYSEKNLRERLIEPSGLRLESAEYFGEPGFNAHNLVFGNARIPWWIRRIFLQPLVPLTAPLLMRQLPPARFRRKTRMYTADFAVLVLVKDDRG